MLGEWVKGVGSMYSVGPLVSTSFIIQARVPAGEGTDTSVSEYKIKDDF